MLEEFSSLDRLMRCPNQILAHARLVREAEGETFVVVTSIVDVCITSLRTSRIALPPTSSFTPSAASDTSGASRPQRSARMGTTSV